jgi:hypothetical protein
MELQPSQSRERAGPRDEPGQADRSGFGIPTILRLLAIALGIVSAAIMAQRGFQISIHQDFATFFNAVDVLFGGFFEPLNFVVGRVLEWLRSLGWQIPQLQPDWKYVFILLWLIFGSVARGQAAGRTASWRVRIFVWSWGGICAAIGGILSGVTSDIATGAAFAYSLWCVGYLVWNLNIIGLRWELWKSFGVTGLFCLAATIYLLFFRPDMSRMWVASGMGLAPVAIFAAGAGLLWLLMGPFDRRWLSSWNGRAGVDILSVLGGAAFVTFLAHELA